MPLFGRKPKPPSPPSVELPAGEEIEQATRATLLQGKSAMSGKLYLTNRRLLFEAEKGEARWMIVPYSEVRSAGLYPWPGATMGAPRSRQQCLCVETAQGEQVWWDFGEKEERAWLPLVQAHIGVAEPAAEPPDA
ncbi:MAG: GRAM domain-containing protein [Dehalococcoidia bacterium]